MSKYKEFVSYSSMAVDEDIISGEAILKLGEEVLRRDSERLCDYSYVSRLIDILAGRSLTLIETLITEKDQQRAAKETLKALIGDQRDKAYRVLYLGE